MFPSRLQWLRVLSASVALLAGCGGGGGPEETALSVTPPAPAPSPGPSPAPTPSPAPAPPPIPQLSWTGSASTDAVGYRVYYGTASGSYQQARGGGINVGNHTGYTLTGFPSGRTYYFAVTAYDGAGNESAFSSEVSRAMP